MKSTINILNKSHSDAVAALVGGGLFAEDSVMGQNIGREVKFKDWNPSMGIIRRDHTFTIIGVQKNWKGDLCYRVQCGGYDDTFGSVAEVNEIEFLD